MPEGDTIFKLATYLKAELTGRRIVSGYADASPRVDLENLNISGVYAQGKHLFIRMDGQRLLRSHLGMWGSWHGYAPGERWLRPRRRASIVIDTGERIFVCFNAQQVEVLRDGGVRNRQLGTLLGPDLLAPTIDYAAVVQRARRLSDPQRIIADTLLDQKIACGIGNVYKSETLFVGRCHPEITTGNVDDGRLAELFRIAANLLGKNTRGGPRVTRRAADEAGHLWVYGRTAQPCLRCDTPIVSGMLGTRQRSTFWCPHCQSE